MEFWANVCDGNRIAPTFTISFRNQDSTCDHVVKSIHQRWAPFEIKIRVYNPGKNRSEVKGAKPKHGAETTRVARKCREFRPIRTEVWYCFGQTFAPGSKRTGRRAGLPASDGRNQENFVAILEAIGFAA